MKLSLTTGAYQRSGNTSRLTDMTEVVTAIANAGFDSIDMGFCIHDNPDYILRSDDWEKKIEQVGEIGAKLGVTFYQSHPPFAKGCTMTYNPNFKKPGYQEYFDEMMRRSMIASAMLGVKWAVFHPLSFPEFNYERELTLEGNHKYFDKYVELGIKNGVGIAYENMLPSLDRKFPTRFCQHYEDLIELADSYNDPMVGICWDTGHANQMDFDQSRALHKIGSRLKCLHINDNHYGNQDEHLLPYMGSIDWQAVIDALVDIDYAGALNYETGKTTQHAWGDAKDNLLQLNFSNAQYLLRMYEEAKAKAGK